MADIQVSPEELHEAYRDVFTTRSGRIVLADLVRHFGFTRRTTLVRGDPYLSAANEGSRTVVVFIERRLTEDPSPSQDEPDYDGVPAPQQPSEEDDDFTYSD